MISYVQLDESQPVPREIIEMGSRNHSRLQYTIARIVEDNSDLIAFPELTIDVSKAPFAELGLPKQKTLMPDIAFYEEVDINWFDDEVQMSETPLLVVEVLSPYQGTQEFADKFKLYFGLGVRSCWLVSPGLQAITVFSPDMVSKIFTVDTILSDTQLNLQVSMNELFRKPR